MTARDRRLRHANGEGRRWKAAKPYQTPKPKLMVPSVGARPSKAVLTGRETRPRPNAVVSAVIDTAVKMASIASATTARGVESIDARRRTPTPALPPMPCTRPMP